jgi:hypothetical protein
MPGCWLGGCSSLLGLLLLLKALEAFQNLRGRRQVEASVVDRFRLLPEERSRYDAAALSPQEQECLAWVRARLTGTGVDEVVADIETAIEDTGYVYIVEYSFSALSGGEELLIRAPLCEASAEYPLGTRLQLMADPRHPLRPDHGTRRGNWRGLWLGLALGLPLLAGGCYWLAAALRK